MTPPRARFRLPLAMLKLPPLSRWKYRPRPFFGVLHDLLDRDGEVTLGLVAKVAAEQTWGLLVLILALPSLVPGVNVGTAPVGGLGIMALGAQMAVGQARPWMPRKVAAQALHKGRVKDALAKVEGMLDRLRRGTGKRRALNLRWTGALVFWIGFLLFLPVPLPFANLLPAAVLCMVGAALLEERPAWGWLGALGAVGTTIYFAISFDLVVGGTVRALARLWR